MDGDRRGSTRFYIECPVSATIWNRGGKRQISRCGTLRDIGTGGACVLLAEPVEAGGAVRLLVHFFNPLRGRSTRVLFIGRVTRTTYDPRALSYKIALEFRRGGRGQFVREGVVKEPPAAPSLFPFRQEEPMSLPVASR